jgi:sugar phosphate isomerase/epimerase
VTATLVTDRAAVASLSCLDFSFADGPDTTFEQAATRVAELGFGVIDVSVRWRFPLTTPEQVLHDPIGVAGHRRAILDRLGLVVGDVFALIEEPGPRPVDLEAMFAAVIRFAVAMGAGGVSVLPDCGVDHRSPERIDSIARALRARVRDAAGAGLRLSIEPHSGSIAGDPDAVDRVLDLVPGLELTLDYSHFAAQGLEQSAVHRLLPRARVLQVRQARPGAVQCPLAVGSLDFEDIVRECVERGFRGLISLEYVPRPALPSDPVDVEAETLGLAALLRRSWRRETGDELE